MKKRVFERGLHWIRLNAENRQKWGLDTVLFDKVYSEGILAQYKKLAGGWSFKGWSKKGYPVMWTR